MPSKFAVSLETGTEI